MIENAALATVFAIIAPFLVSLVKRWGWSPQRVQTATYIVALVFALGAVVMDSGSISWETLTSDQVIGYFAAILVMSQALYVFLLKPDSPTMPALPFASLTPLQRLNETLVEVGSKPRPVAPMGPNGGVFPPPGGA